MDTGRVAEYVRLTQLAEVKKIEGDEYKAEAARLMDEIIEDFQQEGIDRLTIAGRTVSINSRVAANKNPQVSTEDFHKALRSAGLEDYIKPGVSAQALAGYARELQDAGEQLPYELRGVLNVHTILSLGSRSAGESKTSKRTRST